MANGNTTPVEDNIQVVIEGSVNDRWNVSFRLTNLTKLQLKEIIDRVTSNEYGSLTITKTDFKQLINMV